MNDILRKANKRLQEKLGKVNSDYDKMKREALMDEDIMVDLKNKLETAESELESLKRKRTDSISPERAITGILKQPLQVMNMIMSSMNITSDQSSKKGFVIIILVMEFLTKHS
jgi:hypothetical protein